MLRTCLDYTGDVLELGNAYRLGFIHHIIPAHYCNTSVYLPFMMIFTFRSLPVFLLAFPSAFFFFERLFACLLSSALSSSTWFLRRLLSLQPSTYSQICRNTHINTITMCSALSFTCAAGM